MFGRAAKIFVHSLPTNMHAHITSLKCSLHGSLAATGMGHMTPHATLLGLMGEDPETVQVGRLERVMDEVKAAGGLELGLKGEEGGKRIKFDLEKDMVSRLGRSRHKLSEAERQTWHLNPLPAHPNGLRFTVFNVDGDMLATNEYFSVGGGFVVNQETQTAENLYYMGIDKEDVSASRRDMAHGLDQPDANSNLIASGAEGEAGSPAGETAASSRSGKPPFLFATAAELHRICVEQDMTIAQVVWENELAFRSSAEIRSGLLRCESYYMMYTITVANEQYGMS